MRRYEGRVLFVGQSYYHAWYLSRALRDRGWRADVLDWDEGGQTQYHGADFRFRYRGLRDLVTQIGFYVASLWRYDIFHFSNAHGLRFGNYLAAVARRFGRDGGDVALLRKLGKRIVYSNNACLDGVAQTSFASWDDPPPCDDCAWRDRPDVCSDELNLAWGHFRNSLADVQITVGANRADYNADPRVLEVPQFYCVDPQVWAPDGVVPAEHRLEHPDGTVKIYHSVGNYDLRTRNGRNIKSSHLWLPIVERLRADGLPAEMVFVRDLPHDVARYHQMQCDIVVDMLTFGWFGANGREALMLGKPLICYLRPSWLEAVRERVPGYVEELPVVSATPKNAADVLRRLVLDGEARADIGRRSREFAVKWHSPEAGADRLAEIYRAVKGVSRGARTGDLR